MKIPKLKETRKSTIWLIVMICQASRKNSWHNQVNFNFSQSKNNQTTKYGQITHQTSIQSFSKKKSQTKPKIQSIPRSIR